MASPKKKKERLGRKHLGIPKEKVSRPENSAFATTGLTFPDMDEIVRRYEAGDGTQTELAEEYGVTPTAVSRVICDAREHGNFSDEKRCRNLELLGPPAPEKEIVVPPPKDTNGDIMEELREEARIRRQNELLYEQLTENGGTLETFAQFVKGDLDKRGLPDLSNIDPDVLPSWYILRRNGMIRAKRDREEITRRHCDEGVTLKQLADEYCVSIHTIGTLCGDRLKVMRAKKALTRKATEATEYFHAEQSHDSN